MREDIDKAVSLDVVELLRTFLEVVPVKHHRARCQQYVVTVQPEAPREVCVLVVHEEHWVEKADDSQRARTKEETGATGIRHLPDGEWLVGAPISPRKADSQEMKFVAPGIDDRAAVLILTKNFGLNRASTRVAFGDSE